jgi:hypothetical protein
MTLAEPNVMIPPAIQRSADHRYTYEGETYPGVTGILDVLDKPALVGWAANQTADAAIASIAMLPSMLETAGEKGVRSFLTSRKNWTNDGAKDLGTKVHEMAELVVTGQPTPPMIETVRERVLHYAAWWKASGWTLRLAEAMVVFPTHRYGGTFDLLCYDQDGKTVLADIKTGGKVGRKLYETEVLQLAAYGLAPIVAPMGSKKAYPMPKIDRYAVLHVTTEGVKELEVDVGTAEHMAWMACIDLYAWKQSMKGKIF